MTTPARGGSIIPCTMCKTSPDYLNDIEEIALCDHFSICRDSLYWHHILSMHSLVIFAAGTTWRSFWMARPSTHGANQHRNTHRFYLWVEIIKAGDAMGNLQVCLKFPSVDTLWQAVKCLVVPLSRSSASDWVFSLHWYWSGVSPLQRSAGEFLSQLCLTSHSSQEMGSCGIMLPGWPC